jgi:hypothetical protein
MQIMNSDYEEKATVRQMAPFQIKKHFATSMVVAKAKVSRNSSHEQFIRAQIQGTINDPATNKIKEYLCISLDDFSRFKIRPENIFVPSTQAKSFPTVVNVSVLKTNISCLIAQLKRTTYFALG